MQKKSNQAGISQLVQAPKSTKIQIFFREIASHSNKRTRSNLVRKIKIVNHIQSGKKSAYISSNPATISEVCQA